MSHSTVLVIGEDPEKMLEPYDENTEVEPHRSYVDANTPQEHWGFKAMVEHEGLAEDAGWLDFIAAYNHRYKEDEEGGGLKYDSEMDRVYEMSTYNPLSRWDWYQLGGRWTGFFDLKPGAWGLPGQPGLMTPMAKPGLADQARKRDIDYAGMVARHARKATKEIREILQIISGCPPLLPWSLYRDNHPDDIQRARDEYHAQPGQIALKEARMFTMEDPYVVYCLGTEDPETTYVTKQSRGRVLTFAILNHEGWAERGHMGWFGMTSDELSLEDWEDRAWSIIFKASDDDLFSVYDVHI